MKLHFLLLGVVIVTNTLLAASLPVITTQPQNQTVAQGGNTTLSVVATSAISYQWRFNGIDIQGATNSSLQITNAQTTNGYYMVVAKNDTGWVPSQLVYLSINFNTGGTVPFSNSGNAHAQANYPWGLCNIYSLTPITNGTAQVIAGPELDQMLPVGTTKQVNNGYFSPNLGDRTVPTVAPRQTVYYRVDVTYTNCNPSPYTQQSTVLKLVAGLPVPSTTNLYFPGWIEWPNDPVSSPFSPTNQIRILGESFSITNYLFGDNDLGIPTFQWRKDGTNITNPQSFVGGPETSYANAVLTITNAQASDVGVYDVAVFGNNWFIGAKTSVSVQLVNGQGVFQSPRLSNSNFVCDLVGAPTRNYAIESSTNLYSWSSLLTLSNITGTVTFSNSLDTASYKFFRARLLP
jgi:hypothetical protein